MRVSLRWWKIEPPITTNVEGGATGNIASGSFQGGNVTINYPPEPPSLIKDQIKSMWLMLVEDQRERRERQLESDKHRAAVRAWLIGLTAGVVLCLILVAAMLWQFQTRFGFL